MNRRKTPEYRADEEAAERRFEDEQAALAKLPRLLSNARLWASAVAALTLVIFMLRSTLIVLQTGPPGTIALVVPPTIAFAAAWLAIGLGYLLRWPFILRGRLTVTMAAVTLGLSVLSKIWGGQGFGAIPLLLLVVLLWVPRVRSSPGGLQ